MSADEVTKNWPDDVTVDCRNSAVKQLIEAMCSEKLYQSLPKDKKQHVVFYARILENDIYTTVKSKDDYSRFIKMNINEMLQQQQQQVTTTPVLATGSSNIATVTENFQSEQQQSTCSSNIVPGIYQSQHEQQQLVNLNESLQSGEANKGEVPHITASVIPTSKPWQQTVKQESRDLLANTILHIIFPKFKLQDSETDKYIEVAKKIEKDTFDESNSSSQYFYECMDKILMLRQIQIENKFQNLDKIRSQLEQQHNQINPSISGPFGVVSSGMNMFATGSSMLEISCEFMQIRAFLMIDMLTQEYKKAVCPDFREFMRKKLLQVILETSSSNQTNEQVQEWKAGVQKLEAEVYTKAKSWSEYNKSIGLKQRLIIKDLTSPGVTEKQDIIVEDGIEIPSGSRVNEIGNDHRLSDSSTRLQQPQLENIPVEDTKSWRKSVTRYSKNHMRYRCMQAIDPDFKPDFATPSDSLKKQSKKLEKKILGKCESLQEYLDFPEHKILELAKLMKS